MLIVRRKHHSNLPLLELVHHNVDNVACSSSNPFTLYNANESLLSQSVRDKYSTVNFFHEICVTPPAIYAPSHHRQPIGSQRASSANTVGTGGGVLKGSGGCTSLTG